MSHSCWHRGLAAQLLGDLAIVEQARRRLASHPQHLNDRTDALLSEIAAGDSPDALVTLGHTLKKTRSFGEHLGNEHLVAIEEAFLELNSQGESRFVAEFLECLSGPGLAYQRLSTFASQLPTTQTTDSRRSA